MAAYREDVKRAVWGCDRVDAAGPPEVEAAYFDSDLKAWVLSRHADVLAAFQSASLLPGRRELTEVSLDAEEAARLKMRDEVRRALSPGSVREWREELRADAERLSETLRAGESVDLMDAYARPLCLRFAARVTGIGEAEAARLEEHARIVSGATADPDDAALREAAKRANEALRGSFSTGPESLRDSGFVGLSQTLAGMAGAAWYALARGPAQWQALRGAAEGVEQAMEELLRYAGVLRILTRTASEDVELNGVSIRKGERVYLRIFAANHDPARFGEPERLDWARRDPGHFAFGAGGHACVAANLIRTSAVAMTLPLLARFASVELARPVEWRGGATMRMPVSLWVLLGRG